MQPCKTLELLYKLGLKHTILVTFSYIVTVTVPLLDCHHVTAFCCSAQCKHLLDAQQAHPP